MTGPLGRSRAATALAALLVGAALLAAPLYVVPGPDAPEPDERYTEVERVEASAVEGPPTAYADLTPRGQRYVDRALAADDGEYRVDAREATLPTEFHYGDDTVTTTYVVRDGTYYRVETGGDGPGVDPTPLALPVLRAFGLLVLVTGVEALAGGRLWPARVASGVGAVVPPVAAFAPEVPALLVPVAALAVGCLVYGVHVARVAIAAVRESRYAST